MLPPFYTRIDEPRYGTLATDMYHDRTECERGQRIVEDHKSVSGKRGRRLCSECTSTGRSERRTDLDGSAYAGGGAGQRHTSLPPEATSC